MVFVGGWGVGRNGLGDYPRLYRSSFFFRKKKIVKRYLLSERHLSKPNIIILVLPKRNSFKTCLYYFFVYFAVILINLFFSVLFLFIYLFIFVLSGSSHVYILNET